VTETDDRIWRRYVPIGYATGLVSFSSVAAPLLAGFSLLAILTLTTQSDYRGTRGDIAVAGFAIAASLLLFAIQSGLAASQLAVPPNDLAAEYPEARFSDVWLTLVRTNQWRDSAIAQLLFVRTRWAYNFGIIAFLGGLISSLVPGPGRWSAPRIVALCVVAVALAVEVILTFNRPLSVATFLRPDRLPNRAKALAKLDCEPPVMESSQVRGAVYGSDGPGQGLT
jgi:hypothetical protein